MSVYGKDFYFQTSRGVRGRKAINKFGSNLDIDTGTDPETVWSQGGLYTFPTVAAQLSVVSTDANDADGDTGARVVCIQGLDENYKEITEEITLNGLTPVNSTATNWFRVYRAWVSEAGSSEGNEGSIVVNVGVVLSAVILPGDGQTQMAIYTVPAGKTAYITDLSGAITRSSASATATLGLYFRKNGVRALKQELVVGTQGINSYNKHYTLPLVAEEKTDIYVNCIEVTSNSSSVFSNFSMVIL